MTPTNDCNKLNQILLFSVDVVDGHGPTARRPPIAAAPTPQKWRRQAPPMPPKSLCPSSLTRARRTRSTCRPRRRRHDRCLVSPFHFAVVASCSLFPLFSCSFILPDSLTHSSGLLVSSGSSSGGASRPEWRPHSIHFSQSTPPPPPPTSSFSNLNATRIRPLADSKRYEI